MLSVNERQMNAGFLIIRLGLAVTLLIFAVPRLLGGSQLWTLVGKDLHFLPASFPVKIVGLVLLLIQVLGSLGLITGYLFRLSTVSLAVVYGLYFLNYINIGYKTLPLYAAALAVVCLGLMITGPGRFAVAVKIEHK